MPKLVADLKLVALFSQTPRTCLTLALMSVCEFYGLQHSKAQMNKSHSCRHWTTCPSTETLTHASTVTLWHISTSNLSLCYICTVQCNENIWYVQATQHSATENRHHVSYGWNVQFKTSHTITRALRSNNNYIFKNQHKPDGLQRLTVDRYTFARNVHFWTTDFWPYLISSWPYLLTFWPQCLISSSLMPTALKL